jgi:hypothetical protein
VRNHFVAGDGRTPLVRGNNHGTPPSRRRCAAILAARFREEGHREVRTILGAPPWRDTGGQPALPDLRIERRAEQARGCCAKSRFMERSFRRPKRSRMRWPSAARGDFVFGHGSASPRLILGRPRGAPCNVASRNGPRGAPSGAHESQRSSPWLDSHAAEYAGTAEYGDRVLHLTAQHTEERLRSGVRWFGCRQSTRACAAGELGWAALSSQRAVGA